MGSSIIVPYSTRKTASWMMKLYSQFNPKHITKVGKLRLKIRLDDGSYVFFIKPKRLSKYTRRYPTAMILTEDKFIGLYL